MTVYTVNLSDTFSGAFRNLVVGLLQVVLAVPQIVIGLLQVVLAVSQVLIHIVIVVYNRFVRLLEKSTLIPSD